MRTLTLKRTVAVPSVLPSALRFTRGVDAALATPMRAWLELMTMVFEGTVAGPVPSLYWLCAVLRISPTWSALTLTANCIAMDTLRATGVEMPMATSTAEASSAVR
ncbi:hypothetical protein FQZ97_816070 [compost metagenome]